MLNKIAVARMTLCNDVLNLTKVGKENLWGSIYIQNSDERSVTAI